MNSWNFNELTQEDVLDYKACQRKDGSVYGVPEKSDCVTGKELSKEDLNKLALAANNGDKKAKATLKQYQAEQKKVKDLERKEKQEADAKKKKAEAEKDKKGKSKGKKGGGKGKKGGGKKGGGKKGGGAGKKSDAAASQRQAQKVAQSNRVERQKAMRKRLADLQASLRKVKNPAVKKALEESMNDLLKGVAELSKADSDAQQQQQPGSPAPSAPATEAPKNEKE